MSYLFYGAFILFVLYRSRDYIKGFIIKRFGKKEQIQNVDLENVYVPIQASRTFNFSIEIKEVGDGKAIISVVKTKK